VVVEVHHQQLALEEESLFWVGLVEHRNVVQMEMVLQTLEDLHYLVKVMVLEVDQMKLVA